MLRQVNRVRRGRKNPAYIQSAISSKDHWATGPRSRLFPLPGNLVPRAPHSPGSPPKAPWPRCARALQHRLAASGTFGRGRTCYPGTFPDLATFCVHRAAGRADQWYPRAQALKPEVKGTTLRPRPVESLLAVFIDSGKDEHADTITVPRKFTCAADVYTDRDVPSATSRSRYPWA